MQDFFLQELKSIYNYFVASDYDRKEAMKIMDECSKIDRVELIKRPRKNKIRGGGPKKYVLCSRRDPRQPNVREGIKLMEDILYLNKKNEEVFPKGSIIAGFRSQKKLGEIIAPTNPQRVAPVQAEGAVNPVLPPGLVLFMRQGPFRQ